MKKNFSLLCMGLVLVLALVGCTTDTTGAYDSTKNNTTTTTDDMNKDTGSYYYGADSTGNVNGIYGFGDPGSANVTYNTDGTTNAAKDVGDAARDVVRGTGNAISDVGRGVANTVR